MRHIDQCKQCHAKATEGKHAEVHTLDRSLHGDKKLCSEKQGRVKVDDATSKLSDIKNESSSDPFVVVDSLTNQGVFQASFMVEGMTCSSCVGNISSALNQKPWVYSADISLLTNSALVNFEGKKHLDDIIKAIEDTGFSATVEQVEEIKPREKTRSPESTTSWKASYAIGGMSTLGRAALHLQRPVPKRGA